MFCMRTWTFPELAQGYVRYHIRYCITSTYIPSSRTLVRREAPPTERQLWDLYKTYGASCRHLFDCATDPGRYHSLVQSAVESVEDLVRALTVPSRVTETSHFVLLLEPLPDDRSSCRTRIITRAVFEMVWHKHLKKKAIWAQQFYEIFVEHSFMAVSAGWLFEFRTHYLLRQGRTIKIFPIEAAGGRTDQNYGDYTATTTQDQENRYPLSCRNQTNTSSAKELLPSRLDGTTVLNPLPSQPSTLSSFSNPKIQAIPSSSCSKSRVTRKGSM